MGVEMIGREILEKCIYFSNIYSKKFYGLGFSITTKSLLEKTLPLRPSKEPKLLRKVNSLPKTTDTVAKTLINFSTSKEFHDGFHLLNRKLHFIGICRMLLIKKSKIKPNEKRGTRYYAAKIFSSYKNVKFVGLLTKEKEVFYFINSKVHKLNTYNRNSLFNEI